MVGLTLVVIIACVNTSFKGTLLAYFERILHADLVISATGKMQAHETQMLDESLKERIAAAPGVRGVYELREVKIAYAGENILLKYFGEPPVPENKGEARYPIFGTVDRDSEVAGAELYHSTDPTVMVSENFVVHYKKKTGDTIELMTGHGARQFRIIAVVAEYSNPVGTLYMSHETYRHYYDDRLVSGFAVKLRSGVDPAEARRELERRLAGDQKLTIMLNSDIRAQVGRVIDSSFAYTKAVEIAALLVALMGLMNTLLITVMERTRELGVSRAIGMTRSQVARMIVGEAVSQGGLGATVSIAAGTFLGMIWVTQNLAHSLGWVVDFYVPWRALATTLALGLIVTALAAWYPARRAAGLLIVEALGEK
jgi:putative ABC transport system permease protein